MFMKILFFPGWGGRVPRDFCLCVCRSVRPVRVMLLCFCGCPQGREARGAGGQLDMEGALVARDRVGIQDFVLLDETSETAFMDNLKKRFTGDLIYVRPGNKPNNEQQNPNLSDRLVFDLFVSLVDLHRHSAGVREPLQRSGHLQQEADGYLHGRQLL